VGFLLGLAFLHFVLSGCWCVCCVGVCVCVQVCSNLCVCLDVSVLRVCAFEYARTYVCVCVCVISSHECDIFELLPCSFKMWMRLLLNC
jgi:hypothetical protein